MALTLVLLANEATASLPTVHFVALMSSFPIRLDQSVQVFKFAPFCKLSTKFSTSISSYFSQALGLFLLHFPLPRPSFHLSLSGRSGRNYHFFSLLPSGYNGFLAPISGKNTAEMLATRAHCSSHLQCHVISHLSYALFSSLGLSYLYSSTIRFSQYLLRTCASLSLLVVSSLVFAVTVIAFCFSLIFLE